MSPQQHSEVGDLIIISPVLWMQLQRLREAHSPCSGYYDVPPGGPLRTERFIVTATENVVNRQHSAVSILEESCQGWWNLDLLTWRQRGRGPSPDLKTILKDPPSSRAACWLRPSSRNFIVAHHLSLPNPASYLSFHKGWFPKALSNKLCICYSPFQSQPPRNQSIHSK